MSPFEQLQRIASAWSKTEEQDPFASLFDGANCEMIISMIHSRGSSCCPAEHLGGNEPLSSV
jgi:hypothetical protein